MIILEKYSDILQKKLYTANVVHFLLFLTIGIGGQLLVLLIGWFIHFSSAVQLSLEYLFIFTFTFFIIFSFLRHGIWLVLIFILELFIVIHEELNSLYNLKTYMYTGFTFLLGYQDAIPNKLPAGGYPLAIAFAWIFLIYGCYNFTNYLLDGSKYNNNTSFFDIVPRIALDGAFLWQFSLLVEAGGIVLKWWQYAPKSQPNFFGAPMDTLYYYLLAALLFTSVLRFGEKLLLKKKLISYQRDIGWFGSFTCVIFLYFWFFIILNILFIFGYYYWAFLVGLPSLIIFSAIYYYRFFNPQRKLEKLNKI